MQMRNWRRVHEVLSWKRLIVLASSHYMDMKVARNFLKKRKRKENTIYLYPQSILESPLSIT